jgi:hypothetical protein
MPMLPHMGEVIPVAKAPDEEGAVPQGAEEEEVADMEDPVHQDQTTSPNASSVAKEATRCLNDVIILTSPMFQMRNMQGQPHPMESTPTGTRTWGQWIMSRVS